MEEERRIEKEERITLEKHIMKSQQNDNHVDTTGSTFSLSRNSPNSESK